MTNSAKRKGDWAELELARQIADLTGYTIRRKLGAGRLDDTGDIDGLPDTCLQAKWRPSGYDRFPTYMRQLEQQRQNAGCPFAGFLTRHRGGLWIAHQTLDQFLTLWREATTP